MVRTSLDSLEYSGRAAGDYSQVREARQSGHEFIGKAVSEGVQF